MGFHDFVLVGMGLGAYSGLSAQKKLCPQNKLILDFVPNGVQGIFWFLCSEITPSVA